MLRCVQGLDGAAVFFILREVLASGGLPEVVETLACVVNYAYLKKR
jgi:hypothetical protein